MIAALMAVLATFRSLVRLRLDLQAEIFALRQRLPVLLRRAAHRPSLRRADRLVWVLLSRVWPDWRIAVQIVTPDTVIRWHRRAFAPAWRWKSRPCPPGRPAVLGRMECPVVTGVFVLVERA